MSDINTTTVMGRLVREPLVKNGRGNVGFFSVASNQRYRDAAGVQQEEVAFVACKIFGAWCDALSQCHKGDTVIVSGRLRTESWEKDGTKRTQLALICTSLHAVRQPRAADGSQEAQPVTARAIGESEQPDAQEQLPF